MTELELYKFLHDEDGPTPEMYWWDDELIVFIHNAWIENFIELIDPGFFDDGGYSAKVGKDYTSFDLVILCEYYGIEPENIFPKDKD